MVGAGGQGGGQQKTFAVARERDAFSARRGGDLDLSGAAARRRRGRGLDGRGHDGRGHDGRGHYGRSFSGRGFGGGCFGHDLYGRGRRLGARSRGHQQRHAAHKQAHAGADKHPRREAHSGPIRRWRQADGEGWLGRAWRGHELGQDAGGRQSFARSPRGEGLGHGALSPAQEAWGLGTPGEAVGAGVALDLPGAGAVFRAGGQHHTQEATLGEGERQRRETSRDLCVVCVGVQERAAQRLAEEQLSGRRAQGVDVACGQIHPGEALGAHVAEGAVAHGLGLGLTGGELGAGDAQVEDLHLAPGGHAEVLGLNVTVLHEERRAVGAEGLRRAA